MSTTNGTFTLRMAEERDITDICRIYNYYVLNTAVTFDVAEQTLDERKHWLDLHNAKGLPVLVAEKNTQIIGWASLSYYHSRCAYKQTVEFSIYVDPSSAGKGIGRQLLSQLIALASSRGYHCIVGLIWSENIPCINLARAFGFTKAGELKEVGRKFDKWLDVTFMQKILSV